MSVQTEKATIESGPPRKRRPLTGLGNEELDGRLPAAETALMRAVFEDAILCYIGRGRRRRIDARILAREADYWFRCEDWESPFSFNNVCQMGFPINFFSVFFSSSIATGTTRDDVSRVMQPAGVSIKRNKVFDGQAIRLSVTISTTIIKRLFNFHPNVLPFA